MPTDSAQAPLHDDHTLGISGVGRKDYGPGGKTIDDGPPGLNDGKPAAEALAQVRALPKMTLQLYAMLFVVVDGTLQAEEQKVDYRCSAARIRVYMRAAVPQGGLEFDPRAAMLEDGRTHRVQVIAGGGELLVNRDMRCTHFAVGHAVNKEACARYIFECPLQLTPALGERGRPLPLSPGVADSGDSALLVPGEPGPEYYEGKPRR